MAMDREMRSRRKSHVLVIGAGRGRITCVAFAGRLKMRISPQFGWPMRVPSRQEPHAVWWQRSASTISCQNFHACNFSKRLHTPGLSQKQSSCQRSSAATRPPTQYGHPYTPIPASQKQQWPVGYVNGQSWPSNRMDKICYEC